MKEITILSGKGGAGKTSIMAALATTAGNAVLCDNDVSAANLHLLLQPEVQERHNFTGSLDVTINGDICTACGLCKQYCRFGAIEPDGGKYSINPFECEGCLLCYKICPVDAITVSNNDNSHWYVSNTRFGKLVHAKLGIGAENSGKLVTQVRNRAREIATADNAAFILNDGPPGIGCSAISSITGTDMVVLVIEPSKTGVHDALRLLELVISFNIHTAVIINKFDINPQITESIESLMREKNIRVIARLPFDKSVVQAMTNGKTLSEYQPESIISSEITKAWDVLKQ
jgi:MinD superfamily P-loop ATPase